MANPRRTAILALLRVTDLLVVAGALVVAACAAVPGEWRRLLATHVRVSHVILFAGYLGYWHLALRGFGLYEPRRLAASSREWRHVVAAVLVSAVPLWAVADLAHIEYATPTFAVALTAVSLAGLGAERRLFLGLVRALRGRRTQLRDALIVGDEESAFDLVSRIARRSDLGYRVLGVVDTEPGQRGAASALARVRAHLERLELDELVVALPLERAQTLIRGLIGLCQERGIAVRMLSGLVDPIIARAQVDELDGRPVMSIFTGPPDSIMLAAKRMLDVVVSLVVMVVLAPVLALVAMAIKLDSPGPALFVQDRVGYNGRRFRFFKFRTMVLDAEQRQAALEALNEADGPVFKIRNDPRITRVGRWLRRLSLDELPQFINVLRNDMSLVGPRPLPVRDVVRMQDPAHRRRFSVKPGITCLWQVNARTPRFGDWIKTDMAYIDGWSLGLDLRILLRTIPAVLTGRGAY